MAISKLEKDLKTLSMMGTVTIRVRACGKGFALTCANGVATQEWLKKKLEQMNGLTPERKKFALRFAPGMPEQLTLRGNNLGKLVQQAIQTNGIDENDVVCGEKV